MSNFKGTKGKWVLEKNDYYFEVASYDEKKSMRIIHHLCKHEDYKDTVKLSLSKEANSNALLISKAPEMLEMLEYLIESKLLYTTKAELDIIKLIKEATELC